VDFSKNFSKGNAKVLKFSCSFHSKLRKQPFCCKNLNRNGTTVRLGTKIALAEVIQNMTVIPGECVEMVEKFT